MNIRFRPLLGLFFIESLEGIEGEFEIKVSVPYWGFFLLNIGVAKKDRSRRATVSVPYWGFFLLNW